MCMFELEQLNIEIIKPILDETTLIKDCHQVLYKAIKNVLKAIYTTYEDQYGFNHIDFS